jgi:hypothetical protein
MTKKLLMLAAATFLLSSLALAVTVDYSTTGVFSSTGTGSSGTLPVTFTGVSSTSVTTTDPTASLGSFTITTPKKCMTSVCQYTDTLTITITQTAPNSGTGTLKATVTGTFVVKIDEGVVTWSFTGLGFTDIDGILYIGEDSNSSNGSTGSVTGEITTAPEPNAKLLLGLGSFAMMGLATISRKMIVNY